MTVAATIARAHLFGAAPSARSLAARFNAPPTRMPVVLSGILATDDPKTGLAILGPTADAGKLYAVGQSIPGGAHLHAVYENQVLIERDGAIESLRLPGEFGRGVLRTVALVTPPPPDVADASADGPPPLIGGVISPRYSARGTRRGFLLYPGLNMAAFAALGLKPGDLAIEIDGKPLDSQLGGGAIVHALDSAQTAIVTIVRNGAEQEVNLNLAQIPTSSEDSSQP